MRSVSHAVSERRVPDEAQVVPELQRAEATALEVLPEPQIDRADELAIGEAKQGL